MKIIGLVENGRLSPSQGFYKATCLLMTGIIVTGVAAWLTFGLNKVTRSELVQHRSEDREYVQELKSTVQTLDVTVRKLGLSVERLSTILEVR
ncbi:hypothetical protein LCGC14_1382910 [marine sediment metagenome]|uniref:Uncharacterized protein n=1 Tax=marine sediment metagenome TaxID=412755 RepID=A0A0F9K2E1_9ZZZZ